MHGCIVIGMYMCVDMYTAIYRAAAVGAAVTMLQPQRVA
jgi:hypothetical protein